MLAGKLDVGADFLGIGDALVAEDFEDVNRERPERVAGKIVRLKIGNVGVPPIGGDLIAQISARNNQLVRQKAGQRVGTAH